MTVPSHVSEMLRKIRARFGAEPIEQRMLPSDAEFTTLRPVRNATEASVQNVAEHARDRNEQNSEASLEYQPQLPHGDYNWQIVQVTCA